MSFIDWLRFFFKPRTVPFVCEFSKRNPAHDIHDYHREAGGDGTPSHFYEYECWNCNKKFGI